MADTFTFDLVSPEKLLLSEAVTMVTVPGSLGEYGVLAGHAPMITEVNPGVVEVYVEDDTTVAHRLFVSGGFAEVNQRSFTLLAVEAIPVDQLKKAELVAQAREVDAKIASTGSETEKEALLKKLVVLEAKLKAAA